MDLLRDDIWINDIDRVINQNKDLLMLDNKTIFITGATGLVCSPVVDILIRMNELYERNIKIIVAGRDESRVRSRFGDYVDKPYFSYVVYDSTKNNEFDFECDYIIHGASNAYPKKIASEPVETILGNVLGLKQILDFAKNLSDIKNTRIVYVSSSEVYGNKLNDRPHFENEYGAVDILNPRNSYAEGKRAAENLSISYAQEHGVDVVIARPGHIYGPTASETDNRVSSMWSYDAAFGKDIVMKSEGAQLRSYTYCIDCASAILVLLIKGEGSNAYNISNPNSIITIKEMAQVLASIGDVNLIKEEADSQIIKAFNPMYNSSLDSSKLEGLGWKGCFDSEEGFEHTIKILKNEKKEV